MKLPMQGVYLVWSPDGDSVYVGSSMNMPSRYAQHTVAIRLGCRFEVRMDLTGQSKKEIRAAEDATVEELRLTGKSVVNPTNLELVQAMGRASALAIPQEEKDRRLVRMREGLAKVPKDLRRIQAQPGLAAAAEARAKFTPEKRKEISRRIWESRKRNQL